MLLLPPRWGQQSSKTLPNADVGALGPQLECQDGLLCQANSARIGRPLETQTPQAPPQPTAESVLCMSLGACQARGPGISAGPGHLPALAPALPTYWSRGQAVGITAAQQRRAKAFSRALTVLGSNALIMRGDCAVPAKLAAPLIVWSALVPWRWQCRAGN